MLTFDGACEPLRNRGAGAWAVWDEACGSMRSWSFAGLRCDNITSNESEFLGLLGSILYIASSFLDIVHKSQNNYAAFSDVIKI